MKSAWLILGNQLFPPDSLPQELPRQVFMAEDYGLCTHFKYHKHKIILFLTAMRRYSKELKNLKYDVHYEFLTQTNYDLSYEDKLLQFAKKYKISELVCFEIEDKFMEKRILDFCEKRKFFGIGSAFIPVYYCNNKQANSSKKAATKRPIVPLEGGNSMNAKKGHSSHSPNSPCG